MKYLQYLILIFVSVWCFASFAATSYAEQQSVGTKQIKKEPVSPDGTVLKPLQPPLKADPSVVPPFYASLLTTIDEVYQVQKEFSDTVGSMSCTIDDELRYNYKPHVNNCLNKSYSVQEQQAAGCAGNDTVNQCMNKLYKYCMGGYKGGNGSKEKFLEKFKRALECSNNANVKSKQLSEELKTLLNLIP